MALVKKVYVDGETIITAQNLNDIQDEIITQEANKVPITRTVNGKALSSNISLTPSDVGAVAPSRTVNSKALSSNITLNASDIPNDSTVSGTKVDDALETLDGAIATLGGTVGNINLANVQNITVAGTDLDSYTSGGIYYFQSSYTPLNIPTNAGSFGFLIVLRGGSNARMVQYWIYSATAYNIMWMRSNSSSTVAWSDWKRLVAEGDVLLTAKDISSAVTVANPLPSGVTSVDNITVVQAGNVVTVSVSVVRDSTAITTYSVIASGLPIPAKRPTTGNSTIPFGNYFVNGSTIGRPLNFTVGTNGNLSLIRGEVAGTYMGTFTYLTNDFSKL